MREGISGLLRKTLHSAIEQSEGHEEAFEAAAALLLQNATLFIAQRPYRIAEIEFYWAGPNHDDPFVHKDPNQAQFGRFYFHRQGKTLKNGTYKGVDIAVGKDGVFAGILIRSIVDVETGEYTEGSCSAVDRMLAKTGLETVAALADAVEASIDADPDEKRPLFLKAEKPGDVGALWRSARVGLTLKKGATEARKHFLGKHYRFLTEPGKTQKGRPNLVIALHQQGVSSAEIRRAVGISEAQLAKYLRAFERGRGKEPEAIPTELSPESLCELLGALD